MLDFHPRSPEQIKLKDAEIWLWHGVDLGRDYTELQHCLIEKCDWRQEEISIYGKTFLQPRLSRWYGERAYAYSGIHLSPRPFDTTLLSIKYRIEKLTQQTFNSVLINYYRDQNDAMGMHSDDESELGTRPVIASLSLGETRLFLLRHKYRKDLETLKLPLQCGSLLVMKGDTQKFWKHGIKRERVHCGPRINLTFRHIVDDRN